MSTSTRRWFATVHDHLRATGRHRSLQTVLGTVEILDDYAQPPLFNWPTSDIHETPCANPVATLVMTEKRAPRDVHERLLEPTASVSHRHGRGAFPVRWAPGRPWVAMYEDGPLVLRDGAHVVLAAAASDDVSLWANRVLREMLIYGGRRAGFRLCHCAAIAAHQAGAILIIGPSGSGKTDLALKLARHLNARVVTVDRGLIGDRRARLAIGTLPFGLNVHHATLIDIGRLDRVLAARRSKISNHKHYIAVADAERQCGITMASWAYVAAVVSLRPGDSSIRAERLIRDDAAATIASIDRTRTDPGYQVDWLGLDAAETSAASRWTPPVGWMLSYRPGMALPSAWVEELNDLPTDPEWQSAVRV